MTSSRLHAPAVLTARKYRVRWLGFPPEKDTWEPRSSLFRDIPDVVRAYESVHTLGEDLVDDLCVLAVSENEMNDDGVVVKRHHDDEMKSDDENVVASAWLHDFENASGVASETRHD